MSNKSGYVTLKGVELREVVLKLTGWTVESKAPSRKERWGQTTYYLKSPSGKVTFHTNLGENQCWQHAPAVESSVDAALRWLTLDEGHYWQMDGPVSGADKDSSLASIVDINNSMERVTVGNPALPDEMKAAIKFNKPLAEADADSLAVAMCQAYLAYKGGA